MNPMKTRTQITPDEFVARYAANIQEWANQLRALVKDTLPEVSEYFMPGWQLIGYRVASGKSSAYLGYIQVCSDHVHLGFEYGVLLPDPKGILEGKGTQVRYVTVRRASDVSPKAFADLIRAAAQTTRNKNKRALLKLERDARASNKKSGR
jgi:hypothetical protein